MSATNHSINNNFINYVELRLVDIDATKAFYKSVFGWEFQDWGDQYISFSGAGVDGGFSSERTSSVAGSGSLIILYSDQLDDKQEEVRKAGMEIVNEIFDFPGGRRFHFLDPNGNELAIWGPARD